MKKILVILILGLSLVSCHMQFYDEDGFTIFGLGAVLEREQVLVQSHDGFVIKDSEGIEDIHKEIILEISDTIYNVINDDIDVKITSWEEGSYWIEIPPNSHIDL